MHGKEIRHGNLNVFNVLLKQMTDGTNRAILSDFSRALHEHDQACFKYDVDAVRHVGRAMMDPLYQEDAILSDACKHLLDTFSVHMPTIDELVAHAWFQGRGVCPVSVLSVCSSGADADCRQVDGQEELREEECDGDHLLSSSLETEPEPLDEGQVSGHQSESD